MNRIIGMHTSSNFKYPDTHRIVALLPKFGSSTDTRVMLRVVILYGFGPQKSIEKNPPVHKEPRHIRKQNAKVVNNPRN